MFEGLWNRLVKKKKGQIDLLQTLVIGIGVIAFVIVVFMVLLGRLQDTTEVNSVEYNATGEAIAAIAEIPGWLGIIVIAFIAVVVIGVVYLLRGSSQR